MEVHPNRIVGDPKAELETLETRKALLEEAIDAEGDTDDTGTETDGDAEDITDEEIDGMKVAELRELAKDNDIDLKGARKQADIAKAIKAAL